MRIDLDSWQGMGIYFSWLQAEQVLGIVSFFQIVQFAASR